MRINDLQSALAHQNVFAFLKAIRLGEGTDDELGYNRLVGGKTFDSYEHHPNIKVWLPAYNVWSTAAGAYQIIFPTWCGLVKQYGFPDFTPESQDLGAIALMSEVGAIDDVISGEFNSAIKKCSKEWASLPGSVAGQRIEALDKIRQVYLNNGGEINEV